MNLKKIILAFVCINLLYSCADYNVNKSVQKKERHYYSSSGFALIYEDYLYKQKVISKKIINDDIRVMHRSLKTNTRIKIINPVNSKFIETKIYKKGNYPKIFNIVITKKVASVLDLDSNNPFVEVFEVKKNRTFIAKKAHTYEEEKKVAEIAPISDIKMDDLTKAEINTKKELSKKSLYTIIVAEFYFIDSANNLMESLVKKTKMNNISVKKINNKNYRLLVGPFQNFNSLKKSYISLNKLEFENLNILIE